MDLEKVETRKKVKSEGIPELDSAFVMQVVSGPESEDILIDIELVSEKIPAPEIETPKPIFVSQEMEKNSKLWKKVRTHFGAGRMIDGWLTPIDLNQDTLNAALEVTQVVDNEKLEKTSVIEEQVELEIRNLKSVCETGLSNLLIEQQKVKETISAFPQLIGKNSNSTHKAEITNIAKSISEVESNITKFSNEISKRQDGIESLVREANLNQIQGNLDIIYRGIKKSIESAQTGSNDISLRFKEIASTISMCDSTVLRLEGMLTDYLQEVTLNQEIFLRLEDSVDSLRKKLPLFLALASLSILAIGLKVFGVL